MIEILALSKINPVFLLIFSALVSFFIPKNLFKIFVSIVPLFALFLVIFVPESLVVDSYLTIHPYSKLFAIAFLITLLLGIIYSFSFFKSRIEICAACFHAASAIGVLFAANLMMFFIMWELMLVGAAIIMFNSAHKDSYCSSMRYITMHLISSAFLLAGISLEGYLNSSNIMYKFIIDYSFVKALFMNFTYEALSPFLLLVAFLVNIAAFPFSAWLPDSYSKASPQGGVFLSVFSTKVSIFALLVMFGGSSLLIPIGVAMILYGIIYGALENDIIKILCYSIVCQLGFIVVGIGNGSEIAITGASILVFSHIIYEILLFMTFGAVIIMTGKRKCSDLGSLSLNMKVTSFCAVIASFSVVSFPLSSAFFGKAMIIDAMENNIFLWFVLVLGASSLVLSAGIRLPWMVFFAKNEDNKVIAKDPPPFMLFAMICAAIFLITLGFVPEMIFQFLPNVVSYNPYFADHIFGQIQLIVFAGFGLFAILPFMKYKNSLTLDFDWFYRILIYKILSMIYIFLGYKKNLLLKFAVKFKEYSYKKLKFYFSDNGVLSSSRNISSTVTFTLLVIIVMVLLCSNLVFPLSN